MTRIHQNDPSDVEIAFLAAHVLYLDALELHTRGQVSDLYLTVACRGLAMASRKRRTVRRGGDA